MGVMEGDTEMIEYILEGNVGVELVLEGGRGNMVFEGKGRTEQGNKRRK